jgi:hypothetical protein
MRGNGIRVRSSFVGSSVCSRYPIGERLQPRTCNLVAWVETAVPGIYKSIRDARVQLYAGHQDIYTYSLETIAAEPTTNTASTDTATTAPTTNTARTVSHLARYDFNRHSPVLPWAQRRQVSLPALDCQLSTLVAGS